MKKIKTICQWVPLFGVLAIEKRKLIQMPGKWYVWQLATCFVLIAADVLFLVSCIGKLKY